MKLSIVTINWNNADGLEKTMQSVASQTFKEFEYVVIDGASTDDSVKVIKTHENGFDYLKWVSEPDAGIYNAMNKGIRMASGDYIQILNSGDYLAAPDVTERMLKALKEKDVPSILYGNMVKCFPDGRRLVDKCFAGQEITMLGMYTGTLNHDPAYIRRDLFEKYGYYDESLKIVSDWKWYLQAIIFGGEKPKYVDVDVTLFDMTGISENGGQNRNLIDQEKRTVLEQLINPQFLRDYDNYASDIYLMRRVRRHKLAYKMVWFMERVLFKIEKNRNKRSGIQKWE
jgi:glycosyltransferase involved in cell wall biosynthesis